MWLFSECKTFVNECDSLMSVKHLLRMWECDSLVSVKHFVNECDSLVTVKHLLTNVTL